VLTLPELSLYISHTCDIGCDSCFTYNNLNWGGHFKPEGHLEKLKGKVDFETITILGGEPTTNPHLNEWMTLVDINWPNHQDKWIVTNGRKLSNIPSNWNERGWQLEISAHSPADLKSVFEWFEKEYPNITYEKFTEQHEDGDTHYYMRNGIDGPVFGKISEAWFFYKESLIAKPGEVLTWDRLVDAEQAHANCIARECMYFLEGRFYRCARQALLPQLAKTFQIDAQYRELASQDLGCTVEEFVEWSKTRLEPQSQCAFCPWAEIIKLPEVSNSKKIKVLQV
jgi:hypothetical protein